MKELKEGDHVRFSKEISLCSSVVVARLGVIARIRKTINGDLIYDIDYEIGRPHWMATFDTIIHNYDLKSNIDELTTL